MEIPLKSLYVVAQPPETAQDGLRVEGKDSRELSPTLTHGLEQLRGLYGIFGRERCGLPVVLPRLSAEVTASPLLHALEHVRLRYA